MVELSNRLYELFESAWLAQRQNPGGISPYLSGHLLGFAGTIDITSVIDPLAKTGVVKLKVGGAAVQTKTLDFSDGTPAALTPSAAIEVFEAANFTGVTFSLDADTNRLRVDPTDTSIKFLQIYGDLAGALNFGNCRYTEGKGCYLYPSIDDDLKTIAETVNWSEDTVIENDGAYGSKTKYTRAGNRSDVQLVITDKVMSIAMKQMINGGQWLPKTASAPETYLPPTPNDNETRRVDIYSYSNIFSKNDNTEGDETRILERIYFGCIGHMAQTGGAGSWKDSEYTLTAAAYVDEAGKEQASPREHYFTPSEYEAYQLRNVVVRDWENA
jgi:hypothetical protein